MPHNGPNKCPHPQTVNYSLSSTRSLGIANFYNNQATYSIEILNGSYAELNYLDERLQLNVVCKKDGVIINNPDIKYSVDNDHIALVTNTGMVVCIGNGFATVTATYMDIKATITIRGTATQQDNFEIVFINPADNIRIGQTKDYNIKVMNNGVEVASKPVQYAIINEDASEIEYAIITNVDGYTVSVKTNNVSSYVNKYIYLRCALIDDVSVFVQTRIKIANLY